MRTEAETEKYIHSILDGMPLDKLKLALLMMIFLIPEADRTPQDLKLMNELLDDLHPQGKKG